jgi:hypothetical protein
MDVSREFLEEFNGLNRDYLEGLMCQCEFANKVVDLYARLNNTGPTPEFIYGEKKEKK